MGDQAACQLAVGNFRSEVDDFDSWVELLEVSVKLAYSTADDATQNAYCISWLPLKLDDHARTIYANVTVVTWPEIKTELKKLLVDPQEKYKWLARRDSVVWNGIESLHSLATCIKKCVDKFDPNREKEPEYFFRFRRALPPDYRKAIDLACGDDSDECTIDAAKKIALRLQMANADATATASGTGVGRAVAFTGAAMSDDRHRADENMVQNRTARQDGFDARVRTKDNRSHIYSSSSPRYRASNSDRDYRSQDQGQDDERERHDHRGHNHLNSSSDEETSDGHRRDNFRSHDSHSHKSHRDHHNRDRYQDGRDRNRDRWDTRGNVSWDRRSNREEPASHDRPDRWESRDGDPDGLSFYNSADMNAQVEFIATALSEKHLREPSTGK